MFKAVLWDMDGVLIDSEPGYNRADAAWFADLGLPFGREEILAITGANAQYIARWLKARHPHLTLTEEELVRGYTDNLYASLTRDVTGLIDGVSDWLDWLEERGVLCAIGSSATRRVADYVADTFGLRARMGCIVTGDDVENAKPAPDIYLRCAERLGVAPGDCLVVEDSVNGVWAGLSAGMSVLAYTGTNRHGVNLSEAMFHVERYDRASFDRVFKGRACHTAQSPAPAPHGPPAG
jgi:beta-phosphoglucomutase-like phosphatase (HAD superfamily)